MFKRIKSVASTIIGSVMLLSLFSFAAAPLAYATDSKCAALEGVGLTTAGGNCAAVTKSGEEKKVNEVLKTVVDLLSLIVGIVAVIMIIISGLKFVTASGDTNSVASAKSTLIYALVGLVVVSLAQFIVRFVLVKVG